mmetsp:Transcript_81383/g.209497  ORF Transcript_81383/g.209497 Transcript_81383/m.209497 type:complete len:235 (+) Transcript_81383:910-1614(+)
MLCGAVSRIGHSPYCCRQALPEYSRALARRTRIASGLKGVKPMLYRLAFSRHLAAPSGKAACDSAFSSRCNTSTPQAPTRIRALLVRLRTPIRFCHSRFMQPLKISCRLSSCIARKPTLMRAASDWSRRSTRPSLTELSSLATDLLSSASELAPRASPAAVHGPSCPASGSSSPRISSSWFTFLRNAWRLLYSGRTLAAFASSSTCDGYSRSAQATSTFSSGILANGPCTSSRS